MGMQRRQIHGWRNALSGLVLAVTALTAASAAAKEYVLVGSYGNKLYLIDPIAMQIARMYDIPGPGTGPTEIAPSPDGRIAYALTNRWSSVSGIDLDTGQEVFRADLTIGDVRVHALFGLEVSPDGKSLYVFEQRVRVHSDRFEVLDPVIAVYRTDAGTGAKPERLIPTPRQIQHLAASTDGRTLYAHGIDLYAIDIQSGEIRETFPVAHWQRPGYGPADSIAWLGEQLNSSGIYAMPFYASKLSANTMPSSQRDAGVLSVDLKTGAVSMDVVGPEDSAPGMIGMTANPKHPNEVIGVGGELFKIDRAARRVVAHASTNNLLFYVAAVSSDGERVYTGGGHCRVGIFAMRDLTQMGLVELPNCAVMAQSSLRLVNR
jgi:quinohemoprotein amine dehydrogenase beta subunit